MVTNLNNNFMILVVILLPKGMSACDPNVSNYMILIDRQIKKIYLSSDYFITQTFSLEFAPDV